MGNIARETIPGGVDPPDLRKGVISIFANLSDAAVVTKRAEGESGIFNDFSGIMQGIIPLATWGPQQTTTIYQFGTDTVNIETFPGVFVDVDYPVVDSSSSAESQPSFIGVFVGTTSNPELTLVVHIQTQTGPSCVHTISTGTGAHWDSGTSTVVIDNEDSSYVDEAMQDYFGNSGIAANSQTDRAPFGRPTIGAGTEANFHVLVSWDLTNGAASHGVGPDAEDEIGTSAGADTVSKMWCAIDGVNKNGYDLPATWAHDDTGSGNPNEILSFITGSVSGNYGADTGVPSATLTLTETSIPFYPVAFPSEASLMRVGTPFVPNSLVREARIQFFAGVSIDTSIEENVTAFRLSSGEPAPVATARDLLSKVPIVEFVTATAMINGTNSGSAGNLTKAGTVTAYNP